MLAVVIKIRDIDYENTFQHIFPTALKKIMSLDSNNLIVRLFQQLGDAALPVLLSLMYRIPEDTKRELLVRSLNAYSPVLRDKLNEEFLKDKWGQCLQIGTIFVDRQNDICLNIGRIKVDYQALLNNGQVTDAIHKRFGRFSNLAKTAAGVATVFAPNSVEKKGLDLLWTEENKARLMELIKGAIFKHGIRLELDEIQLMQDEEVPVGTVESNQPLVLTEKMEDDIICALAGYLRDNISDGLAPAQ